MEQEEIDRLGALIAASANVPAPAAAPLMDARLTLSDALSWERYCMKRGGPVTWEDMASAAHLMVRIAAQAIPKQ